MPDNFSEAPGWWVRDFLGQDRLRWRMASLSLREHSLAFSSGDDGGERWDRKYHRPLIKDVPTKEEALQLAIPLLSKLEMQSEWATRPDGTFVTSQRVHGTGYVELGTTNYLEAIQQRGIYLYQKIGDGILLGDERGTVYVSFISDRSISDIQIRTVVEKERVATRSLSKKEIQEAAEQGNYWLSGEVKRDAEVAVSKIDIVYSASGRWQNNLLKPFFRLHVSSPEDKDTKFLFIQSVSDESY